MHKEQHVNDSELLHHDFDELFPLKHLMAACVNVCRQESAPWAVLHSSSGSMGESWLGLPLALGFVKVLAAFSEPI